MDDTFGVMSKNYLLRSGSWRFSPTFFSKFHSFLSFAFESMTHLELLFVGRSFSGNSTGIVLLQGRRPWLDSWVRKVPWERDMLTTPVFQYSWASLGSDSKESTCNAGNLGLIPVLEEGMVTLSSMLAWRISMDRGAWYATTQGVTKSQTWLSQTWLSTAQQGFSITWFSVWDYDYNSCVLKI